MKKQLTLLILSVALVAGSCKVVGTLYPLSRNENDFIFKKELIGKWGDNQNAAEYYTVDTASGQNGKLYKINNFFKKGENNTDSIRYLANLVMISGWYYLDCWLDLENEFRKNDKNYEDLLISRHFIFRLEFREKDQFEIAVPDEDELIKLIDQKKIIANYANLKKDDYLILDKPAILQKAVAASQKYPLLYKEKTVLHRLE